MCENFDRNDATPANVPSREDILNDPNALEVSAETWNVWATFIAELDDDVKAQDATDLVFGDAVKSYADDSEYGGVHMTFDVTRGDLGAYLVVPFHPAF